MKAQLLTISTVALLLIGQSAMALEHINSENGYDPAFRNGWVDASTASNLDMVKPSYQSQPSKGFEHINSENGYDPAFRNGWVSPETSSAGNLDIMKPSYRSNDAVDMNGRYVDPFSINYISTY